MDHRLKGLATAATSIQWVRPEAAGKLVQLVRNLGSAEARHGYAPTGTRNNRMLSFTEESPERGILIATWSAVDIQIMHIIRTHARCKHTTLPMHIQMAPSTGQ
jgi:hypothetical protein